MPLFSVIIPVHNRTDLLTPTLQSVLQQECQDFELIIVDDGSTEDVAAAIVPWRERACLVRQENRGPGAARNRGIAEATGQYVAFLDSDDLWFPWTLSTYRQAIRECPTPSFIAGQPVCFTEESQLASLSPGEAQFHRFDDYLASAGHGVSTRTSATVVRTDRLREVGGFLNRRSNAEDCDLWLRLGTAAGFVYIESPPVLGYRQHAGSAVSNSARSYQGNCHLIVQERRGAYPGGAGRQSERRRILTAHVRPLSLACLREGKRIEAWRLYRSTFEWHLREGRARYLAGFPVMAALERLPRKDRRG